MPLGDVLPLALLLPVALAEPEELEAEADVLPEAEADEPDVDVAAPDGVVPEMVPNVLAGVVPVEDPVALAVDEGGLSLVISNC